MSKSQVYVHAIYFMDAHHTQRHSILLRCCLYLIACLVERATTSCQKGNANSKSSMYMYITTCSTCNNCNLFHTVSQWYVSRGSYCTLLDSKLMWCRGHANLTESHVQCNGMCTKNSYDTYIYAARYRSRKNKNPSNTWYCKQNKSHIFIITKNRIQWNYLETKE